MTSLLKTTILAQFEAALSMLKECISKCPPEHWDGKIAKYTFWQVAYHTLCFVDLYLSPTEAQFQTSPVFHPKGMAELDDEYPSRRFTQAELINYIHVCHEKLVASLAAETPQSLEGPTGHSRRDFPRAELYLYNMRHVQHHTGQLSAYLRRAGVDTRWVSRDWR